MKNEEWRIVGFAVIKTVQYLTLDKASATHLQDSCYSCDSCSKKTFAYDKLTTNLPNPTNTYRVATYKIRQIRAISVRKKTFAYIKLNTNLPRIHTGSQPKRFVLFVRFVFEKKTFAYVKLTTNLPNQTNHVNADRIKKTNPSTIPIVLSRNNQTEIKI